MFQSLRTANYEIHPLQVVEKMDNAHGIGKNFALLRVVFGNDMPEEIVQKYKSIIVAHNESQINSRLTTVGFPLILPKDVAFYREFSSASIDFNIKLEMWYRSNDSYDFCAFDVHPTDETIDSPLMIQNKVIEPNYRDNLSISARYFPIEQNKKYVLKKTCQPVKIYHPMRCPLYVLIEDDIVSLTHAV